MTALSMLDLGKLCHDFRPPRGEPGEDKGIFMHLCNGPDLRWSARPCAGFKRPNFEDDPMLAGLETVQQHPGQGQKSPRPQGQKRPRPEDDPMLAGLEME